MFNILTAVDIDEVILRFIENFIIWHNKVYGTNVRYEDLVDYLDLDRFFGFEPCGLTPRFHEFARDVSLTIPPMEGAIEAIDFIRTLSGLMSITGRQLDVHDITHKYFQIHLPDRFKEIILCNQFRADVAGISKAQICKQKGVTILIDDSYENAIECGKAGIIVLLFGKYPWNDRPIPADLRHIVFPTPDWAAVVQYYKQHFQSG